jgi:hypothetical protein
MQQRQLRLGDILDDYCPRERRITNHAIVAIVGQEVRQTRCVTCEAEHEYKQARIPPQRKKKPAEGALYQDVLNGMPATRVVAHPAAEAAAVAVAEDDDEPLAAVEPPVTEAAEAGPTGPPEENEGPVHRPLIRATLPRPEGQVPVRPVPDFTVRQPGTRPGRFRSNGNHRRPGGFPGATPGAPFNANGRRGGAPVGRAAQGNRARPAQPDRQGGGARRRGGKKRSK